MSDDMNTSPDEEIRQLIHDLRNSLFVIRQGLTLLQSSEMEASKQTDVLAAMSGDEELARMALKRLAELTQK